MGSGKSTVGRLVAAQTGAAFLDLDRRVEETEGRSIATLIRDAGEPAFRDREAAELSRALEHQGPLVVALGGGALVRDESRRAALERARVVSLVARRETLEARLRDEAAGRPLLHGDTDLGTRIAGLLEARAAVYAEAHAWIRTDERTPEAIAAAVAGAWTDGAVLVPLGARSYGVRVAADAGEALDELLRVLEPTRTFVVTDENVARVDPLGLVAGLAARGWSPARTFVLPAGEEHKTLGQVERALVALVEGGADRGSVVIAYGGGVVSDMAGFAAATLLRGVRWIVVPTTLLAMVDAAMGGKTGVDLGVAKNAVGAFHQPAGVVTCPAAVRTEGARAFVGGLAEVVKSAAVGDASLLDRLDRDAADVLARDEAAVREVVERSAAVKARLVAADERESGPRAFLNFGHTVGHALEAEGAFARLTHGEAVSLGMVAALRIGRALGVTPPALADRVVGLLGRLGLPADLDAEPLAAALPLVGLDKKRRGARVRFVLLRAAGEPVLHDLDLGALAGLLGNSQAEL
jgi:shikimate kinase/3-dehydroquinate synthase